MKCPICASEKVTVIYSGQPGYQEPQTFDILACPDCNTSFVDADGIDTGPIYDSIYKNARRVPGYSRYIGYARDALKASSPLDYLANAETVYWAIKQRLETSGKPLDAPILEVGSGLGYLTYALNKSGRNVVGIDISDTAVQNARKRYGGSFVRAEVGSYSETHAGQYDFVIATEVIEHIGNIYPFLESCIRLLKPGGELLVSTPNRDSCASDVLWETEAPPVHFWWFSARSFQAIAKRLSCALTFVDMSSYHDAPFWTLCTIPNSPCVTRWSTLDASGNLVARLRPRPFLIRAWGKLLRLARARFAPPTPKVATRESGVPCGPSPTLCAVFKKNRV